MQGAIFDLDGVLVDSEKLYQRAYAIILRKHGVDFSKDILRRLTGTTLEKGGARNLKEYFSLPIGEDLLIRKIYRIFDMYKSDLKCVPGVLDLLMDLRTRGLKVGLATSTVKYRALLTLEYAGVRPEVFDALVFGDDVAFGKPSPDVYLSCLKILNVPAEKAVAFEDSVNGVRAAAGAGIKVIVGVLHDNNDALELLNNGATLVGKPPSIFQEFLTKFLLA